MFLDRVIFNKTKIPALNAVLDVTQLRQRVISNNIANVSTAGYRKQDLRFQEYLDSFVKKPAVEGVLTDPRHMAVPKPVSAPEVYEPETGLNDTGLNNVDVDKEMTDLAENHLHFNVGARLLSGGFDGLRKAITGDRLIHLPTNETGHLMQIFDTLDISATGLSAQRRKMTAIASNIANVDTTRTDEGGPYKRRRMVMLEAPKLTKFSTMLEKTTSRLLRSQDGHMIEGEPRPGEIFTGSGVLTQEVREEPIKPRMVYDPNHPDAREDGYVVYPDVNVVTEMVDMIASSRAYEANATVLSAAKDMINRSLEI